MNKRKYLIMLMLSVITLSLSGCGSQEEAGVDGAASLEENNQVTENVTNGEQAAEAETSDDVQDSEAKAETDTTEDTKEPEVEVDIESTEDAEEPEVEVVPDEPEVEMVDFETWAKQEGNEEPCLVVWNETTGKQEIIQPKKKYIIEEGDRFAIPYRDVIVAVNIEKKNGRVEKS